jgi:hypothetical protein
MADVTTISNTMTRQISPKSENNFNISDARNTVVNIEDVKTNISYNTDRDSTDIDSTDRDSTDRDFADKKDHKKKKESPAKTATHKKSRKWTHRTTYGNETSDNTNRSELLWTDKIEGVIKGWHHKCLKNAEEHAKCAKKQKAIFYGLSIPASILPFVLAVLVESLVDDYAWINLAMLIIAGILNIVNGYLNPGSKSTSHQDFEALYNELAVEITSELVKPQSNRQAADVYTQRIMDRYNNLNNRAPNT